MRPPRIAPHRPGRLARHAALVALAVPLAARAAPVETAAVALPDARAFPESLTSLADGTLIVGSLGQGLIYRARPGAAVAEPWILPGSNGLEAVFGVLADEASGTLWACSNPPPGEEARAAGQERALKSFDLRTGAAKGSYPLPGEGPSLCNDIAIGPDGSAYVTDTYKSRILRLRPGAARLEVWAAAAPLAGSLDGLAFSDPATLYVNAYDSGRLWRIALGPGGGAGSITEPHLTRPLEKPDGMRPVGRDSFLLIEGAGRLDHLTIEGDGVGVETVRDGFTAPTGVTPVKDIAWVVEGKLGYLFDPRLRGQDPGPFFVRPVVWRRGD